MCRLRRSSLWNTSLVVMELLSGHNAQSKPPFLAVFKWGMESIIFARLTVVKGVLDPTDIGGGGGCMGFKGGGGFSAEVKVGPFCDDDAVLVRRKMQYNLVCLIHSGLEGSWRPHLLHFREVVESLA